MSGYIGSADASGSVARNVKCEKCGGRYHYYLFHTATGTAESQFEDWAAAGAANVAEDKLIRTLDNGVGIVPCPACGWVQAEMTAEARRRHVRWMLWLGWSCIGAGALIWLWKTAMPLSVVDFAWEPPIERLLKSITWGSLGAGAALIAMRTLLTRSVDLNRGYPKWPRDIPGALSVGIPGRAAKSHLARH